MSKIEVALRPKIDGKQQENALKSIPSSQAKHKQSSKKLDGSKQSLSPGRRDGPRAADHNVKFQHNNADVLQLLNQPQGNYSPKRKVRYNVIQPTVANTLSSINN